MIVNVLIYRSYLNNVIKYGYQKGLSTRVVTNGYWAKYYETAIARLKDLVDVGLTEINFSTGDEHAKYVSINNIINAVLASVHLNIPNIFISVESPQRSAITSSLFKKHPVIGNLIASNRVGCIDAS